MAFSRPGVYIQESLTPTNPVTGPSSTSVAAFVGGNDRGPLLPTLVTSWNQYTSLYGTWNNSTLNPASNDLPLAVYLFFANGGRQAYINRVVYSGDAVVQSNNAATATKVLKDRTSGTALNTLELDAKNPGSWGNNVNITITDSTLTGYFNLTVYYNGNTDANIVERFTDLSMTATDSRYAVAVINAGSAYITAVDSGSNATGVTRNPALQNNTALAGGVNGLNVTSAQVVADLTQFDTINESLILNMPNFTDATAVNGAISYATGRGDVFVVVDGAAGLAVGTSTTAGTQLYLAASYTATSQAAVYYPQLVIADPTAGLGSASNATRSVAPGGAVIGQIASTDAVRGVFKAPAGLQTRLAGVVSVTPISNSDLDALNTSVAPVNAIKYVPGSGIVIMGARTLKAGYIDRYIPVRRTLIYLEKSLKDLSQFAVFEPNDATLWRRLNATLSSFLTNFWTQGGLSGATPQQAFYVKIDDSINPQQSIDNGELHVEVGVALQRPAEYVIIKIGQFNGNTTVTVA